MTYPVSCNELDRLGAVKDLKILDTGPEAAYQQVCEEAARAFDVPVVLISLLDARRQWFKARVGYDQPETPRDQAFCNHTILSDEPLIVEDALEDARFATNPLVQGEPKIRFYAGAPILFGDDIRLGSLCLVDTKPRSLTKEQIANLLVLAGKVSALLWHHDVAVNADAYRLPDEVASNAATREPR